MSAVAPPSTPLVLYVLENSCYFTCSLHSNVQERCTTSAAACWWKRSITAGSRVTRLIYASRSHSQILAPCPPSVLDLLQVSLCIWPPNVSVYETPTRRHIGGTSFERVTALKLGLYLCFYQCYYQKQHNRFFGKLPALIQQVKCVETFAYIV